jgi:hypothetical protein
VLQERFGHPDRAASAREHGRQARELHKLALRELHAWLGRRRPARLAPATVGSTRTPRGPHRPVGCGHPKWATPNLTPGRPQSWSAPRRRSASARSSAATSSARAACSLAFAASGPPSSASRLCTRALSCSVAATASANAATRARSALLRASVVCWLAAAHRSGRCQRQPWVTDSLPLPELTGSCRAAACG